MEIGDSNFFTTILLLITPIIENSKTQTLDKTPCKTAHALYCSSLKSHKSIIRSQFPTTQSNKARQRGHCIKITCAILSSETFSSSIINSFVADCDCVKRKETSVLKK